MGRARRPSHSILPRSRAEQSLREPGPCSHIPTRRRLRLSTMSCRYAVGNDRCQYESYTQCFHDENLPVRLLQAQKRCFHREPQLGRELGPRGYFRNVLECDLGTPAPQIAETDIAQNGQKPRIEGPRLVEALHRTIGPDEGFLRQVLRFFRISNDPERETVGARPVSADERLESPPGPALQPSIQSASVASITCNTPQGGLIFKFRSRISS